MTYVVTERCIKCKYNSCIAVCPVNCFYEGETMLVIHPDECIDCGACDPACPAEAIFQGNKPEAEPWLELNEEYSEVWPNITAKGEPLPDADSYKGMDGKFEKFFSPNPGKGG
ncbi:MAG: ferredoxin family protein [Kiloniellales bacterium]